MNSIRRRFVHVLIALSVGVLTVACASGGDDVGDNLQAGDTDGQTPDWITRVYPAPGAETTATQAIQVRFETLPAGHEVRLIVDGIDVTSYAQQGTGALEYDMAQETAPVELDPGDHSAVLELYTVEEGASEGADSFSASERAVIDSYSWDFTIS